MSKVFGGKVEWLFPNVTNYSKRPPTFEKLSGCFQMLQITVKDPQRLSNAV